MRPSPGSLSSRRLVDVVLVVCLANLLFVGALAAVGALETAEQGDVVYLEEEELGDGKTVSVTPVSEYRFASETPTDVDAFFNAIVRVRSGGPLYNLKDPTPTIQEYHYHPATYYMFLPLYFLGYPGFKLAWLLLSMAMTAGGTALLLLAERNYVGDSISKLKIATVSIATLGFGPMVTNFKTGQTTPFIFGFVCLGWWAYRTDRLDSAGAAVAVAALVKPYFMAPVALGFHRRYWRLFTGFAIGYGLLTVVGGLQFGPGTATTYFDVLGEYAVGETSATTGIGGINWTASTLRAFDWLGSISTFVRVLAFVPLAYVGLSYSLADDAEKYAPALFGATLVGTFILVDSTSVVDAAILLAALVVFGFHTYTEKVQFVPVTAAFVLLHVHPWTLELLVGAGPRYIGVLSANQDFFLSIVAFLQPGLYGLVLLYAMVFYVAPPLRHSSELPGSTHNR